MTREDKQVLELKTAKEARYKKAAEKAAADPKPLCIVVIEGFASDGYYGNPILYSGDDYREGCNPEKWRGDWEEGFKIECWTYVVSTWDGQPYFTKKKMEVTQSGGKRTEESSKALHNYLVSWVEGNW